MGFILVEQTQTSVEHTKFSLLYFVEHNQTMFVEHNHTMPVEHTNVTRCRPCEALRVPPDFPPFSLDMKEETPKRVS